MAELNPYEVLGVPATASEAEIDEAYNSLFDEYEPEAQSGDQAAVDRLQQLNDAYDLLSDPTRRAALDSTLRTPTARPSGQDGTRTGQLPKQAPGSAAKATAAATATRPRQATGHQQPTTNNQQPASMRMRRRSQPRPRAVPVPKATFSPTPFIAIGVLLAVALAVGVYLILTRSSTAGPPPADPTRGTVVATVNGQPVYQQDYEERVARDKDTALSDPFYAPLLNNFQGITGTRALDVLKYDALDRLINIEVVQQQAQKENSYPSPDEQKGLIEQAKQKDVPQGESFPDFLKRHNITDGQYNRRVIQNVVIAVMADAHMPKTGSDEQRQQAFLDWICATRQNYDVKIYLTFFVDNKPCTSGWPPDIALPGLSGNQAPEPISTAPAGTVVPGGTPTVP